MTGNRLVRFLGAIGILLPVAVVVAAVIDPPTGPQVQLSTALILVLTAWAMAGLASKFFMVASDRTSLIPSLAALVLGLCALNMAHANPGSAQPMNIRTGLEVAWFYGWMFIDFTNLMLDAVRIRPPKEQ